MEWIIIGLSAISLILLAVLLARKSDRDVAPLVTLLNQGLKTAQEEIAASREENSRLFREFREEVGGKLERSIESLDNKFAMLLQTSETKIEKLREITEQKLTQMQEETSAKLEKMLLQGQDSSDKARDQLSNSLREFRETLVAAVQQMESKQTDQSAALANQVQDSNLSTLEKISNIEKTTTDQLSALKEEYTKLSKEMRSEHSATMEAFTRTIGGQVEKLSTDSLLKIESLREQIDLRLRQIREDNDKKLEQMRATVDEKLESTLEKRLGESFQMVSERLERVHQGLGEMQVLAAGVGDLKRVLTNVKSRGTWGEVQLGALLEDILTPEQYASNVPTKNTREQVEYAIKLPGKSDREDTVWLPIDSKFPIEDYHRLVEAQDAGDIVQIEAAGKQIENIIRQCARDIRDKYLNPPSTTDFAILFLPTEGLFAEVIRRSHLSQSLQREFRVMIAGPTTFCSLLNSLQMGFRTLAIEKRSSEVWELLAAVKTEWSKYGDMLLKVKKKLDEASNTVDMASTRTRAIGRKLARVQELPVSDASTVLMMEPGVLEDLESAPSGEA